ncbi:MAG: hypothetical protein HOU81_07540 [Hamadaea sp.]|uniref:DUF6300 family protein n=1 Tax=Hamadaea sp. TaxID=2024425 RepID=UPI0017F10DED|nr:DUF6300 family protein [Hamadaea sp.]NUR70658.1 hypothetical protein [Hamadaea sp.]NUT23428.1 hypothetical protein [Hamadaea sp.]
MQVSVAGGRCDLCGERLCLTARITSAGRSVGLCPRCDSDNPHGAELIAYFATRSAVAPQDRAVIADLLGRWLGSLDQSRVAAPTPSLAEAAEAWWSGYQRRSAPDESGADLRGQTV